MTPISMTAAIVDGFRSAKFLMTAALALAFAAGSFAYQPKPEPVNIPEDQKPEWMKKAEREMIVVATSGANACEYYVVAHGAILRIRAKNPYVADQVAVNHRKADITPRQRAMLDFAMKVCLDSRAVDDADYAALRAHGFSDEDAWDIAAITALFGLSNRMANATSMRPNDEFYLMGRVPRQKA